MPTLVTRTYLELRSPQEFKPAALPSETPRVERVGGCPPAFYRFLYTEVGRAFSWTDRLAWSDATIVEHLGTPGLSLWLLTHEAAPAGYFELKRHADGSTEIAYFGLLSDFIGRGWGKYLLGEAVREAWGTGPSRVWLHTCTLDHPAALPNYLKRGFRAIREETFHDGGEAPSAGHPASARSSTSA